MYAKFLESVKVMRLLTKAEDNAVAFDELNDKKDFIQSHCIDLISELDIAAAKAEHYDNNMASINARPSLEELNDVSDEEEAAEEAAAPEREKTAVAVLKED